MNTENTTLENQINTGIIEDMKQIVTGNPSFRYLITCGNGNLTYVDKTGWLHKLITSPEPFYFISRPRRFGKSLTCSTLAELFKGNKELFEGLSISKTDYDFKAYPVLRFDFSALKMLTADDFHRALQRNIRYAAEDNGITLEDDVPGAMLEALLKQLEEPVIIIDEFDAPVINSISDGDTELAEAMRREFNSFYSTIKKYTEKIRFFFMTGVTKLSGLNIFSSMNNLKDLTLNAEYAGMLGYTEEELEYYFSEHIDECFKLRSRDFGIREEFVAALRGYYDGYRFSPDCEVRVYNPVAIGKYFTEGSAVFNEYWSVTGGLSTLAVRLARSNNLVTVVDQKLKLRFSSINTFDVTEFSENSIDASRITALLFYSGYLTISECQGSLYLMDFPNTEVRSFFLSQLAPMYVRKGIDASYQILELVAAVESGDTKSILTIYNIYCRGCNFKDFSGFPEKAPKVIFKLLMKLLSKIVLTEVPTGFGIADVLLIERKHIYVFEFKADGESAVAAMKQADGRDYIAEFRHLDTELHVVGIDFRTEAEQIVSYTERINEGAVTEIRLPLLPVPKN